MGKKKIYFSIKRLIDVILSFLAIIILFIPGIIIAICIKIESKGPVFFKQKRVGKNKKYFMIYKFRTMVHNAEELMDRFSPEQRKKFEDDII